MDRVARSRAGGLAPLVVFLAAACGGSGSPAPAVTAPTPSTAATATTIPVVKLVVSYSNVLPDYFPVYVAKEAGIYAKNSLDIDPQLIASTTGLPALLSGQTQIAHIGGAEALSASAGGGDVVIVGNTGPVWPYALYVSADIKSAADLKGKKVAIAGVGGSYDIGMRQMLAKLKLAADTDVTIVASGSTANATAALLAGGVQGTLSQPPDALKLEAAGFHVLARLADLDLPTAATTIVVKREYLQANRAVVQRYVDSIIQAIATARSDKALTVAALKKYLKSEDDKGLAAAYDLYLGTVLKDPPLPTPSQLAGIVDVVSRTNDKVRSVDLARLVDDSLVKNAIERGLAR